MFFIGHFFLQQSKFNATVMKSLALALCMVTSQLVFGQYNKSNLKIQRSPRYAHESAMEGSDSPESFDLSFTYKNLRLYPIIANDAFVDHHKDIGKYTTLKGAIEGKKIVITETGATHLADSNNVVDSQQNQSNPEPTELIELNETEGHLLQQQQVLSNNELQSTGVSGTVNTLFAKNNSSDTIFIMAGEVVKGGKQDRVIGQDVVLAPGQEINLSAFCVEKSRWTTKDGNQGAFTGYFNVTSMDIRKTVTKEKSQGKVWEKVDKFTEANDAKSTTKAYTALENSKEYKKNLQEYLDKFENAFTNQSNVIGFVATTGDKVIGCDLFATHDLFIKSYNNLLHSYVTEAITNGEEVTISGDKVAGYLDKLLADESKQQEEIDKNGSMLQHGGKKLHITTFD